MSLKLYNIYGSLKGVHLEEFQGQLVANNSGDILLGDYANNPSETCRHRKPVYKKGEIHGLRAQSHSNHTLADILVEYLSSSYISRTQSDGIAKLTDLITSRDEISDNWLKRCTSAVDAVLFDNKLGPYLRTVEFKPARNDSQGESEDAGNFLSRISRHRNPLTGKVHPKSDVLISGFPKIKLPPLRRSRIVSALVHECLHAFSNAFLCNGRRCQTLPHVERGFGVMGHGPQWENVARAAASKLFQVAGFIPWQEDFLKIEVSTYNDREAADLFQEKYKSHLRRASSHRRKH
ncbi:MAG: hypothetical protein MMC23_009230 [Stictis urceolatum]|nr:hypothetical protein [Stictis urceolata]